MLGLGFVGGIVYLAAYLSLMRGWIGGTSYLFHGTSVISCMMIAVSSSHSAVWPSVAMNIVFVLIGSVFMTKKAIEQYRMRFPSVVDVSTLKIKTDKTEIISVAQALILKYCSKRPNDLDFYQPLSI
tara:strand:- start:381 stop:761 length:381 start_codon:yes stop_codon:yes gene_type:complete